MENLDFWIDKTDKYFEGQDETPLFRGEPFSFEAFASSLKKELNIDGLSISISSAKWQNQDEIKRSLANNISQVCLTFTPLLGNVYLLMNNDEVNNVCSILLSDNKDKATSPALNEGFFRYFILHILNNIKKSPTFEGLSPKIVENVEIKTEESYCLDCDILINGNNINLKIAITPDFRRSWNEFFSSKKSIIINKLQSKVEVPLQLIAGHTLLTKEDIGDIKKGDFIILDKTYIDPDADSNKVICNFNETPIFIAKILKNKIHILDYANYYEESENMEENNTQENISEDNLEDSSSPTGENLSTENEEQTSIIEEEISKVEEAPIKLTVEVAKIAMTLEKLTSLQPGNYLQLPVSLDNPVNLTVNGKKIGSGEITKIGDALGIRILEIGS